MKQPTLAGLFEPETPAQSRQRQHADEAAGRESLRDAVYRLREMAEAVVEQAGFVLNAEDELDPYELAELLEVTRALQIPKRLLLAEERGEIADAERDE